MNTQFPFFFGFFFLLVGANPTSDYPFSFFIKPFLHTNKKIRKNLEEPSHHIRFLFFFKKNSELDHT